MGELILTKRAADRSGSRAFYVPQGSPLLSRMRLAYVAPLMVGAALTFALVRAAALEVIPAAWLLSYGAALLCAGLFSTGSVRVLGAAFLSVGVVAAVAAALNLWLLALGFGGAHLVYGVVTWRGER
jgi:hypothetical protein